jgi:hypothetical protein
MRVMVWQDLLNAGTALLTERATGAGTVITRERFVGADAAHPAEPGYWADVAIEAAQDSTFQRALVLAGTGPEASSSPRRADFMRNADGTWSRPDADGDEEKVPEFAGCEDIEAAGDHASLTFAIRRSKIEVGASREFERVRVELPSMDVRRVKRRLHRLAEAEWRFEEVEADGTSLRGVHVQVDDRGTVLQVLADGVHGKVVRDTELK